jgi:ribosomal protein S18 acetylase RimI-like enzyme
VIGISVERAGPDDAAAVREVRLRALRDAPEAFAATLQRELEITVEQWRERLSAAAETFLCRLDDPGADPAPVGLVVVRADPEAPGEAWLLSMWVAPEARGRGAGDALIRAALHSRTAQNRLVKLFVVETNRAARHLYARHGFLLTGREQRLADGRLEVEMVRRAPA